jgi:hypothetical protein
MGRAEDLFQRIKSGGAAEIDRMIQDQVVEELFLDYKRAATVAPYKKLDASDKKNLSKSIAGFANSEGGVVVWGVDCRPNPPNGDIPTGPVLIANPVAFKSLLEGAISGATLPSHSDVENIVVDATGQPGGFVITHIPSGMNVPYRTLGDREEYYIRAGSNFSPAPHGVLAGLFGRPPYPAFKINVQFSGGEKDYGKEFGGRNYGKSCNDTKCYLEFEVSLVNHGRGIADGIFVGVEWMLPEGGKCDVTQPSEWQVWQTKTKNGIMMMSKEGGPILPPGGEMHIWRLRLNLSSPVTDDVSITVTSGSRNAPGAARTVQFPRDVLAPPVEFYSSPNFELVGSAHAPPVRTFREWVANKTA